MEVYTVTLAGGDDITIEVERKNITTCRLKVFPDKTLKFSVPQNTPVDWIESYLNSKRQWMETKLAGFEKTKGYAATTQIRNGMSIRYLGQDLIFSVSESKKLSIQREGKTLHILSSEINNQDKLMEQFEKWWRKESLILLNQQVDKLYPIIEKYNVARPKVMLRKMKTLWGSCSPDRGVITFNQYLTKASPACIEYVALHELVHFLYPNHTKQFYNFMSSYMPDWKERKKVLDRDEVHGL